MNRLRLSLVLAACSWLAGAGPAEAATVPAAYGTTVFIQKTDGIVQYRRSGLGPWYNVDRLPQPLHDGDWVRTGSRARADLAFTDGSRLELGADVSFSVEEAAERRSAVRLYFGMLKAFVSKVASRRFEVRTPTAVCAVRGTEFRVAVQSGGRTRVNLYKGLLGVEDNRGHQILLHANESLVVERRGMGVPKRIPTRSQSRKADAHSETRREVGLDMSKEEVLAAAAREIRLAEFQQGKVLMDVHGKRVRVEEYIMRPAADQFKFVALNKREGRFDYFYYRGTFNKTLPQDLSAALRRLGGGLDTAPDYFLTGFETGRSNTIDSMREVAEGGHLVDVNNNGVPGDRVGTFFDPETDAYVDATGRSVFKSLFDRYGFYLNGKLKYGWSGTDIQSYSEATEASAADPITGAALTADNAYLDGSGFLAGRTVNTTFPDAGRMHQKIYESYSDGSFISWDNYIIDDEGVVAGIRDFAGVTSGAGFRARLLRFNYEVVVTATEFSGRSIDLVVEPKILIQSGLIQ